MAYLDKPSDGCTNILSTNDPGNDFIYNLRSVYMEVRLERGLGDLQYLVHGEWYEWDVHVLRCKVTGEENAISCGDR